MTKKLITQQEALAVFSSPEVTFEFDDVELPSWVPPQDGLALVFLSAMGEERSITDALMKIFGAGYIAGVIAERNGWPLTAEAERNQVGAA